VKTLLSSNGTGSAMFSDDMTHRYSLVRGPRPNSAFPLFVMLNPSTADHAISDRTITRCAGFTKRLGYVAFRVCNLFSLRATKSIAIRQEGSEGDPVNLLTILESAAAADIVICAWGTLGELRQRRHHVVNALREAGLAHKLCCLGRNKDGSPRHPLYLPGDTALSSFAAIGSDRAAAREVFA
jgi:hypothetical protein